MISATTIYPKGHKHYNVPLDAEHEDMLFDKMWFVLSAKRILPVSIKDIKVQIGGVKARYEAGF